MPINTQAQFAALTGGNNDPLASMTDGLRILETAVTAREMATRLFARYSEQDIKLMQLGLTQKNLASQNDYKRAMLQLRYKQLDTETAIRLEHLAAEERWHTAKTSAADAKVALQMKDRTLQAEMDAALYNIASQNLPELQAHIRMEQVLQKYENLGGVETKRAARAARIQLDNSTVTNNGNDVPFVDRQGNTVYMTWGSLHKSFLENREGVAASMSAIGWDPNDYATYAKVRWQNAVDIPKVTNGRDAIPTRPTVPGAGGAPGSAPAAPGAPQANSRLQALGFTQVGSTRGGMPYFSDMPGSPGGSTPRESVYYDTKKDEYIRLIVDPETNETKREKITKEQAAEYNPPGNFLSRALAFEKVNPTEYHNTATKKKYVFDKGQWTQTDAAPTDTRTPEEKALEEMRPPGATEQMTLNPGEYPQGWNDQLEQLVVAPYNARYMAAGVNPSKRGQTVARYQFLDGYTQLKDDGKIPKDYSPEKLGQFMNWFQPRAVSWNLPSGNPFDPSQMYDFLHMFENGGKPTADGQLPKEYLKPGHPAMAAGPTGTPPELMGSRNVPPGDTGDGSIDSGEPSLFPPVADEQYMGPSVDDIPDVGQAATDEELSSMEEQTAPVD